MSGHGTWSGQSKRRQRESLDGAPGYNGNSFPDSTSNHIYYNGGMHDDYDYGVDEFAVVRDIASKFGLSPSEAIKDYQGVAAFTDDYYGDIRDAQKYGVTSGRYAEWGMQAEQFIKDGVKAGYFQ